MSADVYLGHKAANPNAQHLGHGIMILMSSNENWNACQEKLRLILKRIDKDNKKPVIHVSVTESADIFGYTAEFLIIDKEFRSNTGFLCKCMQICQSCEEIIFI